MSEIVLSYSRRDRHLAEHLHAQLVGRGFGVWVDWERVQPFECWEVAVRSAIDSARALCFDGEPAPLNG